MPLSDPNKPNNELKIENQEIQKHIDFLTNLDDSQKMYDNKMYPIIVPPKLDPLTTLLTKLDTLLKENNTFLLFLIEQQKSPPVATKPLPLPLPLPLLPPPLSLPPSPQPVPVLKSPPVVPKPTITPVLKSPLVIKVTNKKGEERDIKEMKDNFIFLYKKCDTKNKQGEDINCLHIYKKNSDENIYQIIKAKDSNQYDYDKDRLYTKMSPKTYTELECYIKDDNEKKNI